MLWAIINTLYTNEKVENLSDEIKHINRNEIEILELKSAINKKISVDEVNSRMEEREGKKSVNLKINRNYRKWIKEKIDKRRNKISKITGNY